MILTDGHDPDRSRTVRISRHHRQETWPSSLIQQDIRRPGSTGRKENVLNEPGISKIQMVKTRYVGRDIGDFMG